jgi:hypothetical protein
VDSKPEREEYLNYIYQLATIQINRLFFIFVFICLYIFCNTLGVVGFSPSGWYFAPEGRGVGNLSWPLRG